MVATKTATETVMIEAQKMGKEINTPITHDDFIDRAYIGVKSFYIDDLDLLVSRMAGAIVKAVTITVPDEEKIKP